MGLIPGLGRSSGEGSSFRQYAGNPLQYSCLGNPKGRRAWGLQSMGSQRVRHNLAAQHAWALGKVHTHTCSEKHSAQQPKSRNHPKVQQQKIKLRYTHAMGYYSGMKYWHVLQHGWASKTICCVKEARHKRAHVVWFYLYQTHRIDNAIKTE